MEKVFLRLETPFSLKNSNALRFVLMVVGLPVVMLALVIYFHVTPGREDLAQRLSIFYVLWFLLGDIPVALLMFNGYARIRDGELAVNFTGFFEKCYPRESLQKAVKSGQRIQIYAGGKAVVSMPDNPAARNLVRRLRLPADWDTGMVQKMQDESFL